MDRDGQHFVEGEQTSRPDREKTSGTNFGGGGLITGIQADEEFVINNGNGATAHTFTFHPRGSSNDSQTFTDYLQQGQSCRYSGRGIERVSIDSADSATLFRKGPRGTVFAPSNPSGAGGVAASVQKASEVLNSVTTAKMYGAGTGGSAWTFKPLRTGIVRVTWDAFMLGSGNVSANAVMEVLPTYGDSGTVAAPAAGASPPVGSVQPGSGMGFNPTGGMADFSAWNQHDSYTVILFLTAGHTYWFDFEASYSGFTAVTLGDAQISFQELLA